MSWRAAALAALLGASAAAAQDGGTDAGLLPVKLLRAGSEWRYRLGDSAPPSDWAQPTYDDERWKSAPAPLGYGEPGVVSPLTPNLLSYYARARFELSVAPEELQRLTAQVDYDDGFVLFLNGREAVRRNVPSGQGFNTAANNAHESGSPASIDLSGSQSLLVPGENFLAVELHNDNTSSTDAYLEVELTGELARVPPPTVRALSPALGAQRVPVSSALSFELFDLAGVDPSNVTLSLEGAPVALSADGPPERRLFTATRSQPLPTGSNVELALTARNGAGVAMEPLRWTFRTASAGYGATDPVGCGCGAGGSAPPLALAALLLLRWRPRAKSRAGRVG